MLHAIVALDHTVDGEQTRFAEHAPVAARDIAPDYGVEGPGLVLQREKGDAAGSGRLLAHEHESGVADWRAMFQLAGFAGRLATLGAQATSDEADRMRAEALARRG